MSKLGDFGSSVSNATSFVSRQTYNLRWDDAESLSKEQGSMLTGVYRDSHVVDSDENVERVELHNWETDEESDVDC